MGFASLDVYVDSVVSYRYKHGTIGTTLLIHIQFHLRVKTMSSYMYCIVHFVLFSQLARLTMNYLLFVSM